MKLPHTRSRILCASFVLLSVASACNAISENPLVDAAGGCSVDGVQRLIDQGADVNRPSFDVFTPIAAAAQGDAAGTGEDCDETIDSLAGAGADVNVRGSRWFTLPTAWRPRTSLTFSYASGPRSASR